MEPSSCFTTTIAPESFPAELMGRWSALQHKLLALGSRRVISWGFEPHLHELLAETWCFSTNIYTLIMR